MDEISNIVMLCPEKFTPKKDTKLEPSDRAKTDTILLVCNQYVRVIPTFLYILRNLSYEKNERESFILSTKTFLSVVKKEARDILKLSANGNLISSQL
jgi:hypothetical protein